MDFSRACDKISKYLDSAKSTPIIVDVADMLSLKNLEAYFKVGSNEFLCASSICAQDHMPNIDHLYNELQNRKSAIFLTHFTSFLKLEGEAKLKETLNTMLNMNTLGKLIIISYQCSQYLNFSDPRIESSGRIIRIDSTIEEKNTLPTLCFVTSEISNCYEALIQGINNSVHQIESTNSDVLYIETSKHKNDFPFSLYPIKEDCSAFDVLSKNSDNLRMLGPNMGSQDEWAWLLSEIKTYEGWSDYIENKFGNSLIQSIGNMSTMSDNQKWAYFLALKCSNMQNNEYLEKVLSKSNSIEEFWDKLYSLILDIDYKSATFTKYYDKRKELISKVNVPTSVVSTFCKQVLSKEESAIFYLTDCSIQEKELVFELISNYADFYSYDVLNNILAKVYPALQSYLSQYDYVCDELTQYFNLYKYNKLINRITPEFRLLVDKYASDRIFYSKLERRASIVEKKDKSSSKLYFVDALGVEFLNYIRELCYAKQLSFDVDLAYCELPSLTSLNKEFCSEFTFYTDVKDLDELKHSGNDRYNYETTKTPIHIIKELEILSRVIKNVENDLYSREITRVFLISDHGASRLAVINEHENKWVLKEKGVHSGRCCPVSDVDEKPDFAVEDNGYWSIANYDRFQGGRKANVEVHGGATLEEVIVPIIEIKLAGDKPKCEICESSKIVMVSYKVKAKIQIFIAKQTDTAKVFCEGKYYDAIPTQTKYVYDVNMPDIKKGHHKIDIYDGSNRIAEGLEFEAKSAGASETRYF